MDDLTFIAELVKALAGPGTVLALALLFRKPILDLIPLIATLKYKDFEVDFGRRLNETSAEAAALPAPKAHALLASSTDEDRLRALAGASPRAAILEGWIALENAAAEAAKRRSLELSRADLRSPLQLVQALETAGLIDARQAVVFNDLRSLRNSAAHAAAFEPSPEDAAEYVRLVFLLKQSLSES